MGATYDIAVAGAGIVGTACAAECAAAGLKVVVVEPGPIGGGATAAGMGHIVVMDDSPAQMAITRYSRALWTELRSELPAGVECLACGSIWVAADEEEMAQAACKKRLYDEIQVPSELLGPRELAAAEPHLRPGLPGGLLVPGDLVVYAPCAARYLMDRARARGAVLHTAEAAQLCGTGIKLGDGTFLEAGITVNATGAWAPLLTPGVNVRKRKGHLVITERYPGFVRHQLLELGYLKSAHSAAADSVAFNVQPRRTGQLLIGSSRQFGVDHPAIDAPILGRMLRRAWEYMPGLAGLLAIRAWTGFRAATPDNLPLIGPCPEDQRLFLATGHEGLGIATSLATARLVADRLLRRPSAIPIEPYLPGRHFEEAPHV
jgi:glycine/D-amino acid oxidase-like deaminating enzyme